MFFNNCNWCRCWSQHKSCNSNNNCQNKDRKYHDKKCCHVEQSHNYGINDYCHKSNNDYDRFDNNYSLSNQSFDYDSYGYSNFRYYDQYGSFNKFDDDYKCDKKHSHDDECDKKHSHDDCRYDNNSEYNKCNYDPCKCGNKCQPTKFVCFPVDRY